MAVTTAASRLLDWRRVLIYTHRWLGIVGCAFFVTWFASGMVMMYARMPELTPAERLARSRPLDISTLRVALPEAASTTPRMPGRARIGMLGDRPVYRLFTGGERTAIFGDTGETLEGLTPDQVVGLARGFAPEHTSTIRYVEYLKEPDQWTLQDRASLPVHRVSLGDAADTDFYISDRTGEPIMKTTRSARQWAYAGAIPHWIYFTPLRRHASWWAQLIIWLSIAGCLMCLSGLVWGVWRYSPIARYRLKRVQSHSPYDGMMKWHHYAGLIFGLTTFTWTFSGLLSMDPWDWSPGHSPTLEQRDAVAGGPLRLDLLTAERLRAGFNVLSSSVAVKEMEVVQFRGEPYLLAYQPPSPTDDRLLTSSDVVAFRSFGSTLEHRIVSVAAPERGAFSRFEDQAMFAAASAAMPHAAVRESIWLDRYDSYYYDRHAGLPLPVLRVRYRDAADTSLYFDPGRGVVAQKEERLSRTERWLYHGLHSLDFPFLYYRRPAWDIIVIALSIGGIASTVTTVLPALRRLRRHWRRTRRLS
jgi:hypothetical protein